MPVNLIVGNDGSNSLQGTAGADVIYGYNPNGPQSDASTITATRVASGLNQPIFAGAPPGDPGRLFIVEKTGLIKVLDLTTGQVLATPFLDVSSQILTDGERGLLGLAFDPNYASNGLFYVYLINTSGNTEIRRYHVSANPNVADAASATPIITIAAAGREQPQGGLARFRTRRLSLRRARRRRRRRRYLSHRTEHQRPARQRSCVSTCTATPFRAMRQSNYAIPADNPFVGTAGADEIFAFGLRNPWRNSFDRALGTFYIADVGQNHWEEIDIGQNGANYGWNTFEGPVSLRGRSAHRRIGGRADLRLRSHRRAVDHRRLRLSRRRAKRCRASISSPTSFRTRSSPCASTAARGSPPSAPRRSSPMSAR